MEAAMDKGDDAHAAAAAAIKREHGDGLIELDDSDDDDRTVGVPDTSDSGSGGGGRRRATAASSSAASATAAAAAAPEGVDADPAVKALRSYAACRFVALDGENVGDARALRLLFRVCAQAGWDGGL